MDAAKQRVCLLAAVVALVLLQPGTGRGELCTAGPSSDLACAGGGGGSGDVEGPASSTDNAAVRWDQSTGTVIQNSNVLITDGGQIQTPNQNDQSPPAANLVEVPGNAVDLTTNPTCANQVASGSWGIIDTDESAAMALKMCLSNSDLDGFRPPNVGDARIERAQTLHGTGSGSGVWTVDRHDVRDYGALGDGSTDDTTAIRAAIWAACQATGPATVYFPGTSSYYKITERLPVYSESTAHIPANTPASAMVSGCESAGVPLPCCAARNVGYCGVEPYKCDGITFEGDGPKKSRIVQMYTENTTNGDTLSTRPVFDIRAADWITIRDLSLENGTTKATPYPTGTSKSTIASYLLAREWRAGISSIDGVDHLLVDNVHFSNFTADIRLRGHSDNTTKTYDTVVHNSTSSKTTYGILGGDNHVGTRIEGWKVSYEQSETNAPHGVYLAAAHSTARLYDTQITDVQCGDWDGAGLGCDPDGGCLSLRDTTGLTVTNAESVGCGIGDLAGVIGATVTNTRSLAKSTALGNVGGCWGIQNGSTDVDLGDFYCNAGDIIAPGSCGAGTGNPVGCCTGSGTGPTCNNSPVMDLNSATPATDHVKRIHIHDGEIHAYNPVAVAYGAIHVTSGIGTADYIDIHDVDVFNDYTATGIAWPALRVEQRGFFNSARNIRQFPKNNSSRPVRFNFSGGGEWFLDLPDPPGFDDSTLPDVNTTQKNSEVLCHNCSETVTTGVCSTGWTNSNILARHDGQNWICGDGVLPATPTPTATATPTATPTVTATAATPTPTATVTPTLSTPLPTP